MVLAPKRRMSIQDYLDFEERSEVRHEFHDGMLVAMVGVKTKHAVVNAEVLYALRHHLGAGPCLALSQDFKVYVEATNRFLYPDVVVICDDLPSPDDHYTNTPKLIVEVLSPATAAYDRGDKFSYYQMLESLEEYVLVDTEHQSIQVFSRKEPDVWRIQQAGPGGEVELESVGLSLSVNQVYARSGVPEEAPERGARPG